MQQHKLICGTAKRRAMPTLFEVALYAQRVLFITRCMAASAAISYATLQVWNENAHRHPALWTLITVAMYGTLRNIAQDVLWYGMPMPVQRSWAAAYILLTFVSAIMVTEWIRISYEHMRGRGEQYYAQMLVIHAAIFIIAGRREFDLQKI